MTRNEKALKPEDLTRLFVERANNKDADGIAALSTAPKDEAGARAQVARRQPDGSWLRLLDQPEFTPVTG